MAFPDPATLLLEWPLPRTRIAAGDNAPAATPGAASGRVHSLALMGTITMSALHMFLPASEPARSEALAQLKKTHHVPRHLVRGIARGDLGKRGLAISNEVPQVQQEAPSQEPQSLDPPPLQAS